jgi:uncharacterized protein YoxC
MNDFETHIGQITFSSKKLSKSYVSVLSEKTAEDGAELYAIVEIPNRTDGSTWQDYEKISKLVTDGLRSSYHLVNGNSFENALAKINSDLATVASKNEGAAAIWLSKMNAVIAAKYADEVSVATVGKIHAYLLRSKQFSNISESAPRQNPAKLFENFVVGKLQRNDIVILTTSELLNNISLDRLQQELHSSNITESTQLIADLLQQTAEKDISVGTIFLNIGQAALSTEQALHKIEAGAFKLGALQRGRKVLSALGGGAQSTAQHLAHSAISVGSKIREADLRPAAIKQHAVGLVDIKKFRALPRNKKFFISMAALFLILIIADIIVGIHLRKVRITASATATIFSTIKSDINGANSAQIYGDSDQAKSLLADAQSKFASLSGVTAASDQGKQAQQQITALNDALNKISQVSTASVGDFGMQSDRLLMVGSNAYGINYKGSSIADYNIGSHTLGAVQNISIGGTISHAALAPSGQLLMEDSKGALYLYNPTSNSLVAQKNSFQIPTVGLSTYGNSPVKAYTIAVAANGGIISEYITATSHSETSGNFSTAMDIATDNTGAYALLSNNILKFASGQPRSFSNGGGSYGSNSKIFLGASDTYVLDPSNKRIVIMNKVGTLMAQYVSNDFEQSTDFSVNEAQKIIYVLNGSKLLSVEIQ